MPVSSELAPLRTSGKIGIRKPTGDRAWVMHRSITLRPKGLSGAVNKMSISPLKFQMIAQGSRVLVRVSCVILCTIGMRRRDIGR